MIATADSYITKRALAASLKELINYEPFEKITIGDICKKCNMNRKSFYYHFKDKYDLANWIFDTEFVDTAKVRSYPSEWDALGDLYSYFYKNKNFYRRVLRFKGQNSLSEHFREMLFPIIDKALSKITGADEARPFQTHFFTDAFISAADRWLSEKDCLPPDQFLKYLKSCFFTIKLSNER